MADSVQTWHEWFKDFIHGRTHTAYGLIASVFTSGYITIMSSNIDFRLAGLISFAGSIGGLVDITAHLFYH